MTKVISEDALRRALLAIPEAAGVSWLDSHLRESSAPLLDVPWILDIDTTIKPLYGKLEGAVVSYNPKKPGGLRTATTVKRHIERLFGVAGWMDAGQWGWDGFTTHDLHRCQLSARAVALIYDWWGLFARLVNPEAWLEAMTSRPWLMSSVGRRTEHADQTMITLTGLHAPFDKARQVLMRVSSQLQAWGKEAAEQFNAKSVWLLCCDHLKRVLAAIGPPPALRLLTEPADRMGQLRFLG